MANSEKPKVLLLGHIDHARESFAELEKLAEIIRPDSTDRAAFIEELKISPKFQSPNLIASYRTFDSFSITGRIDADLLAHFPRSLRFLSHVGAGYDQIDVAACTKYGISVSNTPGVVDDSTSDIAIFLILGALRNMNYGIETLRRGAWRGKNEEAGLMPLGNDPRGKVLGILGMGGIGQAARDKAAVFGFKTQYYNRRRLSSDLEKDSKYIASLEELLRTSDVVLIALPLNEKTRHSISTKQFEMMKPSAVVVNIARGAIVDEKALVAALDKGLIRSCGLDVFEKEPAIEEGLLRNPKVLLVPHMGTWTVETLQKMEDLAIANVRSVIETGQLKTLVPEQQNSNSSSSLSSLDEKREKQIQKPSTLDGKGPFPPVQNEEAQSEGMKSDLHQLQAHGLQ